jgi:putative transposase
VFGVHLSSYKYWRQLRKPDATRVALLSLVRESYRESNGSAGARNIAAMVTTKGVKLSRWRATKLMKALNIISCQQPGHRIRRRLRNTLRSLIIWIASLLLPSLIRSGAVM